MAARHSQKLQSLLAATATLALMSGAPALAQTATWTGATHMAWNTPTNWSTGTVPDANTSVIVNGLHTAIISSAVTSNTTTIANIPNPVSPGIFVQALVLVTGENGRWGLQNNASLYVGRYGTGKLNIEAGGQVRAGLLTYVGDMGTRAGSGTLRVDGPGSLFHGGLLYLGGTGTGRLEIRNGGQVRADLGLVVADWEVQPLNELEISGPQSKLTTTSIEFANSGQAFLTISAGGVVEGTTATLARDNTAAGSIWVTGENSHLNLSGALIIGQSGQASVQIQEGAKVSASSVSIAGRGTLIIGARSFFTPVAGQLQTASVTNNGLIQIRHSDSAYRLDPVISGTGNIVLDAGTTILTAANTYSGTTAVNAGTLIVNGSIANSTTTVANGAVLGGGGTVGTTTLQTGATLRPGNSIGALKVAGPLTMQTGTTLEVEIRGGGNIGGIHNDLVQVTGIADIAPGTTLVLMPVSTGETSASYAANTKYTVLSAASGLSGTFASMVNQFAFLDASVGYDANNAYVTMTRNTLDYASAAQTGNQRGVADALSDFSPHDPVTLAINAMSNEQAAAAFASASGDAHASGQSVLDGTFSLFTDLLGSPGQGSSGAVMSYLDAGAGQVGALGSTEPHTAPILPNAVWLSPIAGRGTIASDGNAASTDWAAGGLAGGYERRASLAGGEVTMGLGAGYVVSTANVAERNAKVDSSGANIGVYGEWTSGPLSLGGKLSYGASHVTTNRDITIGALSRTATADYWMHGAGLSVDGSYGFELTDGFTVGPMAGLDLSWSGHNGFSEIGAGALSATVSASGAWHTKTALGVSMAYEIEGEAGTFELSGRALWLHDWGASSVQSTVALAGGGAPFTVSGPERGRDRLELGAGLAWSAQESLAVSLDYTGRFFGGSTDHIARAALTVRF